MSDSEAFTFLSYMLERERDAKKANLLSKKLMIKARRAVELCGKAGLVTFIPLGALVLAFGGSGRWSALALTFAITALISVLSMLVSIVVYALKLFSANRARDRETTSMVRGINAPTWAVGLPTSDAEKILNKELTSREREVANVLLKDGYRGTIGELIETSKNLS